MTSLEKHETDPSVDDQSTLPSELWFSAASGRVRYVPLFKSLLISSGLATTLWVGAIYLHPLFAIAALPVSWFVHGNLIVIGIAIAGDSGLWRGPNVFTNVDKSLRVIFLVSIVLGFFLFLLVVYIDVPNPIDDFLVEFAGFFLGTAVLFYVVEFERSRRNNRVRNLYTTNFLTMTDQMIIELTIAATDILKAVSLGGRTLASEIQKGNGGVQWVAETVADDIWKLDIENYRDWDVDAAAVQESCNLALFALERYEDIRASVIPLLTVHWSQQHAEAIRSGRALLSAASEGADLDAGYVLTEVRVLTDFCYSSISHTRQVVASGFYG